jgi:hypothetical protein
MKSRNYKIKAKLSSTFTSLSSYLILLVQYVPATGIWFGIMSIPLVTYISFFFQNPNILFNDIQFLTRSYGFYVVIFGSIFFIDIIIKNPGITSAEISRVLNLSRNSIKYHVDKLIGKQLIKLEKKGHTFQLYKNNP